MKKRLKVAAIAVLCGVLTASSPVLASNGVATKEKSSAHQPSIDGKAGIVIDAKSGKILFEKKIDAKHYPASITKILTTLVAIENNDDLYQRVKFSRYAVNSIEPGSTHIGIKAGEEIPLKDVLYGIMLESANEACNGAAEFTAGSTKEFVKLMNKKAQELGCTNSHFVTTNGLHDDKHYVTARDMATISKAAWENETFRSIADNSNYFMAPTNKEKKGRELWNHHKMVKRTMFLYDGAEGGKTGYTTRAGGTLVTFVKRGNQELISVVLQGNGYELYRDTIKMMNYSFKNNKVVSPFEGMNTTLQNDKFSILKTGNKLSPYTLPFKNLNDITVMLAKNETPSKLSYKCDGKKYIISYDGEKIGTIEFSY